MTDDEQNHFIPHLLNRISRRIESAASRLYRQRLRVGINDCRTVLVLARRPRLTAQEISEDAALDKSVISRALERLRRKGVVRVTESIGRRELQLTAAGVALHEHISKVALERENLILAGFSGYERKALIDFLQRIAKNVPKANQHDPLKRQRPRG